MKYILSAFCVCLFAVAPLSASAQDMLKAKVSRDKSTKEWIVEVSLDNVGEYVAMQVDMDLPEGVTGHSVEKTSRMKALSLMSNQLDNGALRVLAYNLGKQIISGNSGVLFTIRISASKWSKKKVMYLRNIHFTSRASKDVPMDDIAFRR